MLQTDKKQRDVGNFEGKPATQGCTGAKMSKQRQATRQWGIVKFNFMQMPYSTLGDTSHETIALVFIPTESIHTEASHRPIKAELICTKAAKSVRGKKQPSCDKLQMYMIVRSKMYNMLQCRHHILLPL